jgi:UDP-glucose:(heptosyl)LPS alpha-1,3-glucosyltransferase
VRVALVFRNFNLEGSLERNTVFAAKGLLDLGVEVHCFCDPLTRTVELAGAQFHDVRPVVRSRARLRYAAEVASFAAVATKELRKRRADFDIVDVRGASAWEHDVVRVHAVGRAEAERWIEGPGRHYRLPQVRARLSPLVQPRSGVVRAIERLQFRPGRFARLIAVTEQVQRDLVAVHSVPEELVEVMPPPVDLDAFASPDGREIRRELQVGSDDPVLLFVGHDFERKGLPNAVAALAELPDGAHLVVLGDGDARAARALAEQSGVGRRVHFVGRSDRPQRYYRAADLLVMPTLHDPWGIPLVEAMAAGLPSITTRFAGAAELVRAVGAGIVLREPTPEALANAVESLVADPERRARMSEAGRSAIAPFGVKQQAERTLAIYEQALAGRRATEGAAAA